MHTERFRQSHYRGCAEPSSGPKVFYGYCHESSTMRMMDLADYMNNMQTGISNMYQGSSTFMQPMIDAMTNVMHGSSVPARSNQGYDRHEHRVHYERDCSCQCCIRCADQIEFARCGEVRQIPITFDNETRRERNVKIILGSFATESGLTPGWQATVSETEFKIPPCGEKTIILTVNVDCAKLGVPQQGDERKPTTVDSCKVLYATLEAQGCAIRPIVIAIAVLPEHCGAHHVDCNCGCCNCN
jgi:hypothetical protein